MILKRCNWTNNQFPEYVEYHDKEWGVPVYDDSVLFEFLILEGAQAGLSWATILKKRENYRAHFANFSPEVVALYSQSKINEILQDPGIVRNKLKIHGAVINAQKFLEVASEYDSFSNYIWRFVDGKPKINASNSTKEVQTSSNESDILSKDLKRRGFKFVGTTIIYAYMQACGLVNDHSVECFRYRAI